MNRPLFVLQSVCRDRQLCPECRSTETAVFRDGWAARYEMPLAWPACPYGLPMGHAGDPRPVPPSVLGIVVDQPESGEARSVMDRVRSRADHVRPTCLKCPGNYFRGLSEDGLTVDCVVGYSCCTGEPSRGNVYLGSGSCYKHYW